MPPTAGTGAEFLAGVSAALQSSAVKQAYRCWAEIDLTALRENLALLRNRVGPSVRILTVVKADAYGHGLKQIAALLMQSGTDIFGVANLGEAEAILNVGRGWPVLMLGASLPDEIELALRLGVMPTVSSREEAQAFSGAAVRLQKRAKVHVKIDTGMGRLGVAMKDARALIRDVLQLPGLVLEGVYTHYADAGEDLAFSRLQRRRFSDLLRWLGQIGVRVPMIHASNSAALLSDAGSHFNVVRPGLLVYGVMPPMRTGISGAVIGRFRPALSWFCRIGLIKEVEPGARLSYGGTFVAARKMRVAVLTAGYGDGYFRAGSNRSEVLIRGRRCRVVGRVTMDQTLVDVSEVDGIEVGDVAVLIGRQGDQEITATALAESWGTIAWEVLTGITYRVARVYRGGEAA